MPRFFFDVQSTAFSYLDDIGTDYDNLDIARASAWRVFVDMLKSNEKFDGRSRVVLTIRENGKVVGCVTMAANWQGD